MDASARKWAWYAGDIVRKTCAGCGKPLYLDHDGGILAYGTDKLWHVACVLDLLPDPPTVYAWMAGG